ncbi:Hypothetical predicted protein [Olea europaea subsp. europaea]|uniref:Uncharacterized protein n=1 Tax=Olea europaea subsp. europaea TaxID=158383 RepID=A0A8S0R6S4_OLEEU|nr:Hypothetical predicted protein [Olea europaea subsp. europaea]
MSTPKANGVKGNAALKKSVKNSQPKSHSQESISKKSREKPSQVKAKNAETEAQDEKTCAQNSKEISNQPVCHPELEDEIEKSPEMNSSNNESSLASSVPETLAAEVTIEVVAPDPPRHHRKHHTKHHPNLTVVVPVLRRSGETPQNDERPSLQSTSKRKGDLAVESAIIVAVGRADMLPCATTAALNARAATLATAADFAAIAHCGRQEAIAIGQ